MAEPGQLKASRTPPMLRSWWAKQWRFDRRSLRRILAGVAVMYLVILAALYHWQRDFVFVRARWWHEGPPPTGFVARTVKESDGTHLRIWQSGPPYTGKPTIVFF